MASWGASTILIESGAMPNDPDKQGLRRLNTAAIIHTLDVIATKAYEQADPNDYEKLQYNMGGAYDLLVRGGSVVVPGMTPVLLDVAINFEDAVARKGGRVREIGDLAGVVAVDTLDATGCVPARSSGRADDERTEGLPNDWSTRGVRHSSRRRHDRAR